MTTTDKPRAAKAAKAPRAAAFGGFATATPPVAPPPPTPAADPAPAAAPTVTPAAAPVGQPTPPAASEPPTMGPATPPPAPAMSDSPRDLARFLGEQDQTDTGGAGFVRAMLAGPTVDPMQDLVQLNAAVPRHFKEALRLLAFAQRRRERELVVEALAALIGPQLLAEALAAAQQQHRR